MYAGLYPDAWYESHVICLFYLFHLSGSMSNSTSYSMSQMSANCFCFVPHIFVWGSCIWFCIPSRLRPAAPRLPRLPQLCVSHRLSFTQNLSHPSLSHTMFHTHNLVTHHLSHTTLSHTMFHTQLCNTLSFIHNFVTHNLVTHHLSHTILSHTSFHTQLCNTLSFTHNFVTHSLSHTIFHT